MGLGLDGFRNGIPLAITLIDANVHETRCKGYVKFNPNIFPEKVEKNTFV